MKKGQNKKKTNHVQPLEWVQGYGLTVTVGRLVSILHNCGAASLPLAMTSCGSYMLIALDVEDFEDETAWLD